MSLAETVRRRVVPRLVVTISQISWPARLRAALLRARGHRGSLELYFAFDDAGSAIAVLDLVERTAGRDVNLVLRPVVERGIEDDPAVGAKRRHAIADARRLARRHGWELMRREPIDPAVTAPLAAYAASLPECERVAFCVAALRGLWFGDAVPQAAGGDAALVRLNERAMVAAGPYDTPAAVVAGRWFFAHDRGEQIADWLDELGWTVNA